jgi:hypothetical protein
LQRWSVGSHVPEQQLASFEQKSSSPWQSWPPHVPLLQAIEQQSKGRLHGAPSAAQ